jgi:hypothetical protein
MAQQQQKKHHAAAQPQPATAQTGPGLADYLQARGACLGGRGYSVR